MKNKDKFASWVITIALNEAKQILKSKFNDKVIPLTNFHLDTVSDNKEHDTDLKDIDIVINRLKKKETEILVLKYYADLSLQQIADFLGINLSNTKVRLHRDWSNDK